MTPRAQVGARIRGLYGLADAEASGGDPVTLGEQLLAGGCRLVQLRCKGWAPSTIADAARALVTACEAVGATLIVNDHPEVASEVGAHGVHVGQTDVDPRSARQVLGEDRILGLSTNRLDEVPAAAAVADYVAFGPMFTTPHLSRPKAVQGVDRLAEVRARLPPGLPLVAIGGITAARLPQVREAGADAWAVIGAIAGAADPVAATRELLA